MSKFQCTTGMLTLLTDKYVDIFWMGSKIVFAMTEGSVYGPCIEVKCVMLSFLNARIKHGEGLLESSKY